MKSIRKLEIPNFIDTDITQDIIFSNLSNIIVEYEFDDYQINIFSIWKIFLKYLI